MKKNLTEMVFILDRSGSMAGLEADTIGGFNGMIERQKQAEGDALVSTVLFSSESTVIHDRVDLRRIEPMTSRQYFVGGSTALIDAIGGAIHHIGNVHKYAREEDRPEHTVFVITTDGMENASRRYTSDEVKAMVQRQKDKYGWEFLFLGANIDAVETAAHFGIAEDRAVTFHNDPKGQALNYAEVSAAVCQVRANAPLGRGWKQKIEDDFRGRKARR
ncbi:MAG: VWA domain-containing protein [Clostridia bacterium]|nr:VWA domain-containing protein [Clostridia bacterium]